MGEETSSFTSSGRNQICFLTRPSGHSLGLRESSVYQPFPSSGTNRDFLPSLIPSFLKIHRNLVFWWLLFLFQFWLKLDNSQDTPGHMVWPHIWVVSLMYWEEIAADHFCGGTCHFHRSDLQEESPLKRKRWLPCDTERICQCCFTLRQSVIHLKGLVCTWCCLRNPESLFTRIHPGTSVYSVVVWWLGKSSSTKKVETGSFLKT